MRGMQRLFLPDRADLQEHCPHDSSRKNAAMRKMVAHVDGVIRDHHDTGSASSAAPKDCPVRELHVQFIGRQTPVASEQTASGFLPVREPPAISITARSVVPNGA